MKSLEVSEEKANQREESYKEQIKHLTAKLKQAEARAEFAERSVQKLQKEVDRLEGDFFFRICTIFWKVNCCIKFLFIDLATSYFHQG